MTSKTKAQKRGANFWELLTLLFVGLKLTGHIDWSWWWVTATFWGWVIVVSLVETIDERLGGSK